MINEPMSVIQRIYWTLSEVGNEWHKGNNILLYHRKKEFEFFMKCDSSWNVNFVIEIPGVKPLTIPVLKPVRNGWKEVYNWEDNVRDLLSAWGLPEDV